MNPTRILGNEPDPGDMSTEPSFGTPSDNPAEHDLPDDDADKLGDFAQLTRDALCATATG